MWYEVSKNDTRYIWNEVVVGRSLQKSVQYKKCDYLTISCVHLKMAASKEGTIFNELIKYKEEIKEFITLIENSFLIAVKITNCNAASSKAFSSVSIDFERTTSVIFYKTLFKIEILNYFIENGVLPEDVLLLLR